MHLPHLFIATSINIRHQFPSTLLLLLNPAFLSSHRDLTPQGRPFREGITENSALYYGLLGVAAVAFSGATDFVPEFNRWLQLVEMDTSVSLFVRFALVVS
jgi:hypothetical protein